MSHDVLLQPNGAGTWLTGVAGGALDGILPETIAPISLQGNKAPLESIGFSDVEFMKLIAVEANPTITLIMRWNGQHWGFLAHWMGDDTDTGAGPIFVHTLNYQRRSTLTALTMAIRIDNNNSKIVEWPSLKPQQIVMAPNSDGFWEMTVVTMGDTIEANADATNGSTEFGNITYDTKAQEMCFRANLFRINTGAGGLASPTDDLKVQDLTITLDRPLVADTTTAGVDIVAGGKHTQIPEPVQDGPTVITVGWNEPDFIAHASLVDDFKDDVEYKGDVKMTQTIGSDAHIFLGEFALMDYLPPDAGLDRQQRIPVQREFRCLLAQSTPTGLATANPFHVSLSNLSATNYEIGT